MKLVRWLSRIVLSTLLISCLTVMTSWYVVNLTVERVLGQFHLNTEASPFKLSEFLAILSKQMNIMSLGEQSNSLQEDAEADSNVDSGAGKEVDAEQDAETTEDPDAVAVFNGMSGAGEFTQDADNKEILITTEEFFAKKEGLSEEDKMKIFTMLAEKLSREEMQQISAYVEDGITREEMKKIENIMKEKLNESEYEELMSLLGKY